MIIFEYPLEIINNTDHVLIIKIKKFRNGHPFILQTGGEKIKISK